MKKRMMILCAVSCAMAMMLAGCGAKKESKAVDQEKQLSGSITAAGSSALKPLVDLAAEEFQNKNEEVAITVDAGGSGEGLKQVAEGTVQIGNSDVEAKEKLDEDKAKELVDHKVCVVAMAPIVNEDVTKAGVSSLSKEQLKGIFTGTIKNWKEVGGPDEAVVLVTRPTSSGTRATFEKYALDGTKEIGNKSMETDDSGVLLKNVQDTKGAVGYVALSYLVKEPKVGVLGIDGVAPTLENTYKGTYPVWTYEHMYTKGKPDQVCQAFLTYIQSDGFGEKMEQMGYGVSSKMTVKEH